MARLLFLIVLAISWLPSAEGVDLHWLWDNRCADCHGHSGDFARKFLHVEGNQLVGRHHQQELHRFLFHHYALGDDNNAVYQMLLGQAQTPPRFRDECSRCHGSAAEFVRQNLIWDDGEWIVRGNPQALEDFMLGHRNMIAADVEFFRRLLLRLASEIFRP